MLAGFGCAWVLVFVLAPHASATDAPSGNAGRASQLDWVRSAAAGIDLTRAEITVAQFRMCVQAGKCSSPKTKTDDPECNSGYPDRDDHPVNCVDWFQARTFCVWAGGRLPTRDEWRSEASNAGTRTYPWGEQPATCDLAVTGNGDQPDGCGRNSTWPICSKRAGNSASGLCDMAGNVWEWTSSCSDGGDSEHPHSCSVRGGSWQNGPPHFFDVDSIDNPSPQTWTSLYGLRCARDAT